MKSHQFFPHRRGQLVNVTNCRSIGSEVVSLRTVPVWLKKNDRKVKVNAILEDDMSNETPERGSRRDVGNP